MPTKTTLISFDLDNTLWPTRTVLGRAEQQLRRWLHEHHADAANSSLAKESFWQLRQRIAEEQPEIRHKPTLLRMEVLLQGFLLSGYAEAQARQAAQQAFDTFITARNQITFFPQAIEILRHLAEHYRLVAITNGNANLQRIGIMPFFAAQYTAEEVGYAKPAPQIFEHMLKDQNIAPEQCLHVGDHPVEDIDAARQCGLQTMWANLTNAQWPTELAEPQHIVTSLSAIPHTLNQHRK